MIRSNKSKIVAISAFLTAQLAFFIATVITGNEFFASVALSCAFTVVAFSKTKSYALVQLGLLFSVIADVFLVLCEPMIQLPAMLAFSLAQVCYFLKLLFETESKTEKCVHISVRAIAIFAVIIATLAVLKGKTDALSIVSMLYYANLIVNAVFAFVHFRKSPAFAIGLLLFVLCDTIVGFKELSNGYMNGGIIDAINNALSGTNWAWFFYIPSQALIAISLIKFNKEKSST